MTELQKITEHNLATSPFLKLPGEVRNKIYELTLGGNIWKIDTEARAINLIPKADRNDHRDLLLVCRQIYGESRVLPWSLGSFKCVTDNYFDCRAKFRRWVAKFPPEFRRAITSIIFVNHDVGDAPLEDEHLKVHAWLPVPHRSAEDLRKVVMMKPGERIAGNVCVTCVQFKYT